MLLSYDTETTGLEPWGGKHRVFAYSTCDRDGTAHVVRLSPQGATIKERQILRDMLARNVLVMHNSKFDLSFTERLIDQRVAESVRFHDTQLQSHIIRNDHHGHRLKDLAWELAGVDKRDEAEVREYVRDGSDYSTVPEAVMRRYQQRDAERTMLLHLFFWPKIRENPKWLEAYTWERRLVPVTMRMEERGFPLDQAACRKLAEEQRLDAVAALDDAERLLGRRVDLGKDGVVRKLLYDDMRLPVVERTDTGLASVDKETLDVLAQIPGTNRELLNLVRRFRSRRRGASTLAGYLDCVGPDGIIHPNIQTCRAVTGRESCSSPNLQNVEKDRGLKNPYPVPARKVFRPRPGYVNVHIDYSGIELRLLVHYSGDQELVDIIRSGGDAHLPAAQLFYPAWTREEIDEAGARVAPMMLKGIDAYEPDSKSFSTLRDAAKSTNFGVPYGAGWRKAAVTLGLPESIGKRRFDLYKSRFPRLCSLSRTVGSQVRAENGVETTFGRFLYVPPSKAYMGTNYLIQGTAAEVLKRSQVRVADVLLSATSGEVKLLLPIHDEIIMEVPKRMLSHFRGVLPRVRDVMIDFPQFNVPLEVDVKYTETNWADKKAFEEKE
jgi:DNA polymerase-1